VNVPYWLTKENYESDPSIEKALRKILTVHVPSNEIKEICRLIEIKNNGSYDTGIWSAKQLIQKEMDRRKQNERIKN
jgi:hypothetical protein